MEIQCKQCRSVLSVQQPDAGNDLGFECENCGCKMPLRTTLGGTSILSRDDNGLHVFGLPTDFNSDKTDEVWIWEPEWLDRICDKNEPPLQGSLLYDTDSIPSPPTDRNGRPINSKTGQIVYYRKQLAELEKQERYEECAQVRDRLNEIYRTEG